jgi:hypothetical protein
MRKAIFAALAVLGMSLGVTALAPVANAYTSVSAPNPYEGNAS